MGRAFSFHSLTGSLGFVAAPFTMTMLAALWDWRVALLVMVSTPRRPFLN